MATTVTFDPQGNNMTRSKIFLHARGYYMTLYTDDTEKELYKMNVLSGHLWV